MDGENQKFDVGSPELLPVKADPVKRTTDETAANDKLKQIQVLKNTRPKQTTKKLVRLGSYAKAAKITAELLERRGVTAVEKSPINEDLNADDDKPRQNNDDIQT